MSFTLRLCSDQLRMSTLRKTQKRKRGSEEPKERPKKRQKKEEERNWNHGYSATSTRNYLLNDPLVDWLSYHSQRLAFKKPKY